MLSEKQINAYKKNGYLVVEDVIPPETLKILQDVTDAFVEGAKNVTEHNETYDLADDHSKENPKLRRLKNPHLIHKEYEALTRDPCILDLVSQLLGNNLRRDHTKLNFKAANGGEAIEWHQDWAFYPHSNDDMLAFGVFLEDVTEENGPLMVIPKSHQGPILNHFVNGVFCGAVDPDDPEFKIEEAVTLTGKAGDMTVHHARTLHGSAPNISSKSRLMLFYECNAVDAWPLLGAASYIHSLGQKKFWKDLEERLITGKLSTTPRLTKVPVSIPLPTPEKAGSIFELQKAGGAKSAFK